MYICWPFSVHMFLIVYYAYLLVIYYTHVLDCLLCIILQFWSFNIQMVIYFCFWVVYYVYLCWTFIVQMFLIVYYVYLLVTFIVQMFLSVYYVYLLVIYCTHVLDCLICIPVGHLIVQMFLIVSFNYYAYLLVIYCTDVPDWYYYAYLLVIYCTHALDCLLCTPVGHLLYICCGVFTMYICWSFIVQMSLII